jgi:hypothetical protein
MEDKSFFALIVSRLIEAANHCRDQRQIVLHFASDPAVVQYMRVNRSQPLLSTRLRAVERLEKADH